jgi:hypothetical protein
MKPNKLPEGVLVDDEDLEKVLQFRWHIASSGYVVSDQRKMVNGHRKGKMVRLHRFLLAPNDDQIIDHINQNRLDNRRSNLRLATQSQNMRNRNAQSNNSSGYKGICWVERIQRWRAYANLNYRQYSFGYHKTLQEALDAYNDNIESIHGEWAVKQ